MTMRVFRAGPGLKDLLDRPPAAQPGCVATVGVFDGVHRGHIAVMREVQAWAGEVGSDAVVVTFDRHPRGVLVGSPPPMLTSLRHRLVLLDRLGLDAAIVIPFDPTVAQISARDFLGRILLSALGVRHLVLGEDAGFGKGREGNIAFCQAVLADPSFRPRFDLKVARPVVLPDGRKVSSTSLREAVAQGRLEDAWAFLGRPFAVLGAVVRGDGRGRSLGFPTANLDTEGEMLPPAGVYAGAARWGGTDVPALVNVGRRPTFGGDAEDRAEAHLVGWSGDLYGKSIEVRFHERIRDEMRFPNADALVAQLGQDRRTLLEDVLPRVIARERE